MYVVLLEWHKWVLQFWIKLGVETGIMNMF
jgi:hypothetical protein